MLSPEDYDARRPGLIVHPEHSLVVTDDAPYGADARPIG